MRIVSLGTDFWPRTPESRILERRIFNRNRRRRSIYLSQHRIYPKTASQPHLRGAMLFGPMLYVVFGYTTASLASFFVGQDARSGSRDGPGGAELCKAIALVRRELAEARGQEPEPEWPRRES
jgi:hypothetical protein